MKMDRSFQHAFLHSLISGSDQLHSRSSVLDCRQLQFVSHSCSAVLPAGFVDCQKNEGEAISRVVHVVRLYLHS